MATDVESTATVEPTEPSTRRERDSSGATTRSAWARQPSRWSSSASIRTPALSM